MVKREEEGLFFFGKSPFYQKKTAQRGWGTVRRGRGTGKEGVRGMESGVPKKKTPFYLYEKKRPYLFYFLYKKRKSPP